MEDMNWNRMALLLQCPVKLLHGCEIIAFFPPVSAYLGKIHWLELIIEHLDLHLPLILLNKLKKVSDMILMGMGEKPSGDHRFFSKRS